MRATSGGYVARAQLQSSTLGTFRPCLLSARVKRKCVTIPAIHEKAATARRIGTIAFMDEASRATRSQWPLPLLRVLEIRLDLAGELDGQRIAEAVFRLAGL